MFFKAVLVQGDATDRRLIEQRTGPDEAREEGDSPKEERIIHWHRRLAS